MKAQRKEETVRAARVLRDIMTPEVWSVSPDTTLRELVQLLTEEGISGAPVVEGGRVAGVVSVTDVLEAGALAQGEREGAGEEWPDWAEEDLLGPEREATEEDAGAFFTDPWPPAALDAVRALREGMPELQPDLTVGEVMTRAVVALPPDTPVREAAARMVGAHIHRLLVVEDGRLLGVVSATDLVRAVADGRLGPAGGQAEGT